MTEETDYSNDLYDWCIECMEIDPLDDDNFIERLKRIGITTLPKTFNIYLRRRMPDKSLQKVRMWKNVLPGIEEIALAFGSGEAVISCLRKPLLLAVEQDGSSIPTNRDT